MGVADTLGCTSVASELALQLTALQTISRGPT